VTPLILAPLVLDQVAAAVALDQKTLRGVWSQAQYILEINNPMSLLVGCYTPVPGRALAELPLWGLGCSWGIGDETHITLLAVLPKLQGQGIGALLLWALLKNSLGQGRAWATLEVAVDNQVALGLYQTFGFQEAGRRPRYYSSGADALILWCKLSEQIFNFGQIQQKLQQHQWHLQLHPTIAQLHIGTD